MRAGRLLLEMKDRTSMQQPVRVAGSADVGPADDAIKPSNKPSVEPAADGPGPGSDRTGPRSSWWRLLRFLPELAAVLATVWVFRRVIRGGMLPGDIGDARWTIALHEHWYRVWSGQDGIRDLYYYFPLKNTLGTSDAFLVQGQIYSLARLLGFTVVNSWVIAGFGFFLVGALGIAVLATAFGGTRILDVLVGDPLPRIC